MVESESELTPLNWNDIYVVSDRRRLVTADEIVDLQQSCGALPTGYKDFVTTFGFGQLDGIHILLPDQRVAETDFLRESLKEWIRFCKEFEQPFFVPESSPEDGVPLAVTDWGDSYFCSRSEPGVLWYLWRPHDWDSSPSTVPLGFHNPFWHMPADEAPVELAKESLIFHPHRRTYVNTATIDSDAITGDHVQVIAKIHARITIYVSPDKTVTDDYGVSVFVKRWGAYIRFGFQPARSRYYMHVSIDEENYRAYADLQSALERDGYRFTATE